MGFDLESQPITGGVVEVLADAEVAFGGEDGGVAQGELDLLESGLAFVGEFRKGAPQVVGGDLDSDPLAVFHHRLEHRLRPHRVVADAAALVDGPQHAAPGGAGGLYPFIERRFGPGGHRNSADAAVLANQIDDHPTPLALLDIGEVELGEFPAPQAATEQQTKQHTVAFTLQRRAVGSLQQLEGLRPGQPVPRPDPRAFGALDPSDRGGHGGIEQGVVGGLDRQLFEGRQAQVDRGWGQFPALQIGTIALHRRLREATPTRRGLIPTEKLPQGVLIGAAGVLAREAVQDQGDERTEVFCSPLDQRPRAHSLTTSENCS